MVRKKTKRRRTSRFGGPIDDAAILIQYRWRREQTKKLKQAVQEKFRRLTGFDIRGKFLNKLVKLVKKELEAIENLNYWEWEFQDNPDFWRNDFYAMKTGEAFRTRNNIRIEMNNFILGLVKRRQGIMELLNALRYRLKPTLPISLRREIAQYYNSIPQVPGDPQAAGVVQAQVVQGMNIPINYLGSREKIINLGNKTSHLFLSSTLSRAYAKRPSAKR